MYDANTCPPMPQVGLSESNKIYILAGDEEGCTDYVQLGAEDLNQKQVYMIHHRAKYAGIAVA